MTTGSPMNVAPSERTKRNVTALAAAYGAVLLAGVAFLDFYTWFDNTDTNHTSIPIGLMFGAYAASLVAALIIVWRRVGQFVDIRIAWFVLIVSGIAIVNIAAFDAFDIMMEKDRWIDKGMPDRPR